MTFSILYFAPAGRNEGVGGSGRIKNMLDIMEQLGYNINLISYIPKQKFSITKEIEKNIQTTTIYVPRDLPRILKIFAIPVLLFYGMKYAPNSNIIFTQAPSIISGFPAMLISKIFNKSLIVDHIDLKDDTTPYFIYKSILKKAQVMVISHYLEKDIKDLTVESFYIPIFIDTSKFKRDNEAREKIRSELKIKNDEIVIGYSGSFWYIEGVSFLLKAFKKLSEKYERIKLVLIGAKNVDGSENIEGIINELSLHENVILLSQQPHDLMPKFLSVFDIACSPKINCDENHAANPIKIYEYMSMGLITVSSAVGEVTNVIKNGYNGFLVEPENIKELESTLECIINDFNNLKKIGINSRNNVIKFNSQQEYVKKIGDIIKNAI